MAVIEYAPLISDIIDGFTTTEITVSFKDNPAINPSDYKYIQMQIKDYNSSDILVTAVSGRTTEYSNYRTASFTIKKGVLTGNKYYKIQIAYLLSQEQSNDVTYSTVSSGYCIGDKLPEITLTCGNIKITNGPVEIDNISSFIGAVSKVNSEYLYTTRFRMGLAVKTSDSTWDYQDSFEDTGEVPYDNTDRNTDVFKKSFLPNRVMKKGEYYWITFSAYTINNCYLSVSGKVTLKSPKTLDTTFIYVPQDEKAINNGYLDITMKGCQAGTNPLYSLRKRDILSNTWEYLVPELSLTDNILYSYKDNTIEQGKQYEYQLMYYQGGSNSYLVKSIISPQVEFKDIFLSDDERQLRIQFNPQISSFKNNVLEQKIETIGGTFPRFYRNGNVNYKEFPISGLISYLIDDNEAFLTKTEMNLIDFENSRGDIQKTGNLPTTSLENYNIYAERLFKLKVLEWLNNGKPKLFRSPTEGNYIVRLMNVSLSPNDTVGRMLHTFSCTAYECAKLEDYAAQFKNHNLTERADELEWRIFTYNYDSSPFDFKQYIGTNNVLIKDITWIPSVVGSRLTAVAKSDHIYLDNIVTPEGKAANELNNNGIYNDIIIENRSSLVTPHGSIYCLYAVTDSINVSSMVTDPTDSGKTWEIVNNIYYSGNYKLVIQPASDSSNYFDLTAFQLTIGESSTVIDCTDKRNRVVYFALDKNNTSRALKGGQGLYYTIYKSKG